ncbi:MAG: hypothetical protein ACFFDY_00445 [Candidatus Thorarchaeota archaeon]
MENIFIVLDVSNKENPKFVDIENDYYESIKIGEYIKKYAGNKNLDAIKINLKGGN